MIINWNNHYTSQYIVWNKRATAAALPKVFRSLTVNLENKNLGVELADN